MQVINVTKQQKLGDDIKVADTFFARLIGLLATPKLPAGAGLLITSCNSVHMLGMRYPLDVVFVDERNVVVRVVTALQPGRLASKWGARYVIELPAGTIAATCTEVGDKLAVEESC